jgi:death-on-curing protein
MITADKVQEIHDYILSQEPGLHGDHGRGALEGALSRVDAAVTYGGMDDVFEIAAMYAIAIARGHVFNDANKRTALVTALTYLDTQGIDIERTDALEEIMVDVAEGTVTVEELAALLDSLAP